MFLAKRPNGIYQIYYMASNGRRTSRTTGCKRKSDAMQVMRSFRNEIELECSRDFPSITLYKMIWEFLKYSESVYSPKTVCNFKSTFKFVKAYFKDVELDTITDIDIRKYCEKRLRDSSIYQARKDKINLSSLFTRAIDWGFLEDNPCRKVKNYKVPEKQPVYFSKDEFKRLLTKIDCTDLKDLVIFAVNTGMRQTELVTLEWSQVDLPNKLVTLDNRNHMTKSKRVRAIPLNETALEILKKRRELASNLVFTFDGDRIRQNILSQRFRRIIRKNGFRYGLNFHSLRHTFASWLVQSGASIYIVSKLLGHSDIKTTEIYAHLDTRSLFNEIKNLDLVM